jgi:small-conductance mechanosensitive channel
MGVPDVQALWDTYGSLVVTGVALIVGFVTVGLCFRLLGRAGRRAPLVVLLTRQTHKPAQLLTALLMARFALVTTTDTGTWRGPLLQALLVAAVGAGGWLVAVLVLLLEEGALARYRIDMPDNREARRARTQLILLRRVTVALVVLLTVGAALYTFPAVRGIGTSLLASAGLIGVIAGLAAQSTLGNLISGLQLVFGDRLRIDDVVVVEDEYGRIEELTLGYVVVRIWDQRRLVLPTSYFINNPFTIWTRTDAEVLGTVELDVDWTVPMPEMRAELERFVRGQPLWDGRSVALQVTGATGSVVRVRAAVSSANGSNLWDLRCEVREHLVEWIRRTYPQALPRMRAELTGPPARTAVPAQPAQPGPDPV